MLTYVQTINAPVEEVFSCLNEERKIRKWREGVVGIASHSPEMTSGTRFKQKILSGGLLQEHDGEILHYQSPSRLALRLTSPHFEMEIHYHLVAVDRHQTRLHYEAHVSYPTFRDRCLGFLYGWLSRLLLRKQMKALKQLAESSGSLQWQMA